MTNNWSLFQIVEQVQVREFPAQLPFEIHTFFNFSPEEYGRYEIRLLLVSPAGGDLLSHTTSGQVNRQRHRIRFRGLPRINAAGEYQVRVEWKKPDDTWHRSEIYWPLAIAQFSPETHPSIT